MFLFDVQQNMWFYSNMYIIIFQIVIEIRDSFVDILLSSITV